jgi:hypothetical protein
MTFFLLRTNGLLCEDPVCDCNGLSGYVAVRSWEKMECSECSAKSTEDIDTGVPTARVMMGRHYRSAVIDTCRPEFGERAFADLIPFTSAHIIELVVPTVQSSPGIRPLLVGDVWLVILQCIAASKPSYDSPTTVSSGRSASSGCSPSFCQKSSSKSNVLWLTSQGIQSKLLSAIAK